MPTLSYYQLKESKKYRCIKSYDGGHSRGTAQKDANNYARYARSKGHKVVVTRVPNTFIWRIYER